MIADPAQYQLASIVLAVTYGTLAVVWLAIQERSRTNVAVAVIILGVASAFGCTMFLADQVDPAHPTWFARLEGLAEGAVFLGAGFYLLGLLSDSDADPRARRFIRICAWAGWCLGAALVVLGAIFPAQRLNDYELSLFEPGALERPGFWMFGSILLAAMVVYLSAWTVVGRVGLDRPEKVRAEWVAIASGATVFGTMMPPLVSFGFGTIWFGAVLYGTLSYIASRARRSVFLEGFLSPQVVQRVNSRGMTETMRPHLAEITVVSADLRGFTSYSEGVPSQAVVDLLAEYYDAVGSAVARHGATITNYAGDGVLILVGAPIADAQHSATGIQLARDILEAVTPVLGRWETRVHALGLGVGVASGKVTVGAIEAETRMEYTAIGTAVNLAARLCSSAAAGEILVDAEAALSAGSTGLEARGALDIKGLSERHEVYAAI